MAKIWKDCRGQDLIEYALMASFLAVAAGAMVGGVADNLRPLFDKVISVAALASGSDPFPDQSAVGVVNPR
jgi:Flp pilus assembly pilin Flp